jgi:sulfite reductase (ferredoxin)
MSVSWKDKLAGQVPAEWGKEIDSFETLMTLRKLGKAEEKLFAEARLRRGAYGQRYDNGKRNDGIVVQELVYPNRQLTKGPETLYDAPGMQRIKIPFGGLNSTQMMLLADLAEEYSDGILHVTTRQDIQLHYIHIEDTPTIFRRLAAVGITTREACGNSVRNVTACPIAGVCRGEIFDVTPYSKAIAFYLLGHPDTQDFGRKFKIAFSGCKDEPCGLVSIHDLGGIAKIENGKRGFEIYVGGGLGAVPHQAKLFADFWPEENLLPLARAIGRVFARLGEKKNRNRARLKFVVQKLGIDEFKRVVLEELRTMPEDPTWRKHFEQIPRYSEKPGWQGVPLNVSARRPAGYNEWAKTNIYDQKQVGYSAVTVSLPLGDASVDQFRSLADIVKRYCGDNCRTTIEQNIVLRWVPQDKLPELYNELAAIGLNEPTAGTIFDVAACPGTDTCKLGIASSRGLAGELRNRFIAKQLQADDAVKGLRIKVSGCFNSCGQHHVADIGFYGNSRNVSGYTVPHFQVMLGGKWRENGGAYGLAMGAIPSKRVPDLVDELTKRYVAERRADEDFQAYCTRIGKKELKGIVEKFAAVPPHAQDASFYSDWGDPRQYGIGDMGVGECAGEVVSLAQFGFQSAEQEAFEAQLLLDEGNYKEADERAYNAMLIAARTLVQLQWLDAPNEPASIVSEFRTRFVDTQLFRDKYHGDQFSNYLFNRFESPDTRYTRETAHKIVEEANLFIDAAHKAHAKHSESLNVLVTK